ncbi:DUF6314 family protein [Tomitella cavernea]|uniref:DUF6314 domain-containing protein n=1 Tax=Tomitella cavernea TaxID=1387982 RepID=A0ABP9D3G3_9ACTN|nr:DUF6314 family protein [Tomitella cavernea]
MDGHGGAGDGGFGIGEAPDPRTLLGRWAFSRTIDDRLVGDTKTVDGAITLSADGERVRWHEEGTLHLGAQNLPVTRTMFVEPRGDGWFVVFEDGHDFHPWATGTQVQHLCGADLYSGRIALGEVGPDGQQHDGRAPRPESWTVRWDVAGPSKDYTMTTRLTRGR